MTTIRRDAIAAIVATSIAAGALFCERIFIPDPDLRYPIVLLTKTLAIIVCAILIARVLVSIVKEKVRTETPQAHSGLVNLGKLALLTGASLVGFAFGVFLVIGKAGSIEYWPLGIVLMFGVLTGYCVKHLWSGYKAYRKFH